MSKPSYVYLLVAYHPTTGEFEAYLTERRTLGNNREAAMRYLTSEGADIAAEQLSEAVGYRFYVWVVESERVTYKI